jgi:hypothetical protein
MRKTNNTTSGRSRIDNQFRQMPFSAFTDNYLSGCSFQPEQGVSSPIGNELPVHKTSDTSCEVETWEFVGMHLADLRWTPSPPHGGLE